MTGGPGPHGAPRRLTVGAPALALLLGLLLGLAAPAAAERPDWTAAVDQAARDAVAAGDMPGAVILVGQGDRILYRKAFGARALRPATEPMTVDTIFDLASLTKVLATTPSVLALWEDGKLDLDAPIGRYLSELSGPAFREVTIRRVMTHSAGLPDLGEPRRTETLPSLIQRVARTGLYAVPGTTFSYSDTGFILLAEVVHRVSGRPLDVFSRWRFFEPLGMKHTGFRPPLAWRRSIAPTQVFGQHVLRGEVHDGHARALGGVAGHAGLFASADDLARFCRMLLAGGTFGGRRYLAEKTVRAMFAGSPLGESIRALGWDVASPYSPNLAAFFPEGSVGHTGYTGTALWMDPPTRSYMIILTNRVHPDGGGRIAGLRRRVSAAVGSQLFGGGEPRPTLLAAGFVPGHGLRPAATFVPDDEEPGLVWTGLDRLVEERFAPLAGQTVGLVTNQTGIDALGRRGVDLLAAAPGVRLRALFSPEHGLGGTVDAPVPNGRDEATDLPVWSLYGGTRRPSAAMLAGLDTLVFDIQDVGARYYTYLTTLVYVLEEAARHRLRVVVLDRPNPITGARVEGPIMDPDLRSFTAPHPIPVRPGLTMGEFARLVVGEREIPVDLTVIPLEGWHREQWFDETHLPWVNPSPNIRTPLQALLYAGIGLLESTNLSVGRGTDTPFEVVGAPWIADPSGLADALNALALAGVRFEPSWFVPVSSEYAGQRVGGVRLVVTSRETLRPVRVALAVGQVLMERYPQSFRPAAIQDLLVNRSAMWAFLLQEPLPRIWAWLEADESSFLRRRAPYLLYR